MLKKLIYLTCFVFALCPIDSARADLVAHWSFGEGSGATAVDDTGNGHDGAIGGAANWVEGQIGLALDFDGASTFIDMDDVVVDGTWTLALWLRLETYPTLAVSTR